MAEVRLQEGDSLENALRRFKRKVQSEDIIREVKRHSYYLKPGERRRVKQALARKRARKKIRKEGSFAKDSRNKCMIPEFSQTLASCRELDADAVPLGSRQVNIPVIVPNPAVHLLVDVIARQHLLLVR